MANEDGQNEILQSLVNAFQAAAIQPKKESPRFSGKENPLYFLLTFRLATENLTEAQKQAVFRQAMQGSAYTWYCGQRLSDDMTGIDANMEDWENRLRSAFGKTEGATLDELESRRQAEGEAPNDYVRDVIRLCSEVDPSMSEARKVRHLQRGLLPKYQRDMLIMDPKDASEFQAKLLKLATTAPPSATDTPDRALLSSLLAHLVQKDSSVAPVLATTATTATASGSDDILTQVLKRLEAMESHLRPRRGNKKNVTCFACNQKGHYRNECPRPSAPPSENENARS